MRFALIALLLCACVQSSDRDLLALGDACRAGTVTVCTCTGFDSGVQFCNDDGAGYSDCDCSLRFDSQLCIGVTSPEEEIRCVTPAPRCRIIEPTFPSGRTELNGEQEAHGGDRVSSDGSAYQTRILVQTDEGATALVDVDRGQSRATGVFSGLETHVDVTLAGDGRHTLSARCITPSGLVGDAPEISVFLDATPADLTITAPIAGTHYGPGTDADARPGHQLNACATTQAEDAIGGEARVCFAIGTATPTCIAISNGAVAGARGGCVLLECPGGAPFDVEATIYDDAGNLARKSVTAVSCAESSPSVQIVDPSASVMGDPSTRILAAAEPQQKKDKDALTFGAQYDVVACTNVSAGSGELHARLGAIFDRTIGTAVVAPATMADGCPPALPFVVRFDHATLTESQTTQNGDLVLATTLEVTVRDASGEAGTSPPVDVWVDSTEPEIIPWNPSPICDYTAYTTANPYAINVYFATTTHATTLQVTGVSGPTTYTDFVSSGSTSQFNLQLSPGDNYFVLSATEPSGNTFVYPPSGDCIFHVDSRPSVRWVAPAIAVSTTPLNRASDTNTTNGAKWDGALTVTVDTTDPGVDVTFSTSTQGVLGTTGCVVGASNCTATLDVTIDDAPSVDIVATTSAVAGRGVGTATLKNRRVDTVKPDAPTDLVVGVIDRRSALFHITWRSGTGDAPGSLQGFDVRYAKGEITAANIDAAQGIAFLGAPQPPGSNEGIDIGDLYIENDYWFGVRARDLAGNVSDPVLTPAGSPTRARFNVTVLNPDTPNGGLSMRAMLQDMNGDGLSELAIGSYEDNRALFYFGRKNGFLADPSLVITGPASTNFGAYATMIGDVTGDGRADLAVSASTEGSGKVYIFAGRAHWPEALDSSQADSVIMLDEAADPKYIANDFGYPVVALGDYDGDGADDFAIGNYGYDWDDAQGGGFGGALVVFGVKAPEQLPPAIVLPQMLGTRAQHFTGTTPTRIEFGWDMIAFGRLYDTPGSTFMIGSSLGFNETGPLFLAFAGDGTRTPRVDFTARRAEYTKPAPELYTQGMRVTGAWLGTQGFVRGFYGGGYPLSWVAVTGSGAAGPFVGTTTTFTLPDALTGLQGGYQYGGFVTSGFDGTTFTTSLIGKQTPDLAFWGTHELYTPMGPTGLSGLTGPLGPPVEVPPHLYFITGETWAARAGTSIDLSTTADVIWSLPNDVQNWGGMMQTYATVMRDHDGDGYADIALMEAKSPYEAGHRNRVLVLW